MLIIIIIAYLDYASVQLNFTLSETEQRHYFNISIIDDMKLENDKTFSVIMTAPNSPRNLILVLPEIAINIFDDNDGRFSH